MPTALPLAAVAVFPVLVVLAALKDATSFTIPNRLTIAIAALFVPAALLSALSPAAWLAAAGCGAGALVIGMAMFAFGWVGGGDAKLFAACGLWVGASAAAPFLLWTGLAGGALAVALLLGRNAAAWYPGMGPSWMRRLLTKGEGVPYGVAIAAGALIAFPASPVMRALGA